MPSSHRPPTADSERPPTPETFGAADVVTAAVRQLVADFDATEAAALAAESDGVHRHRTVVRRLRSVLSAFGDLYDPAAVTAHRAALKEWGTALGVVRDLEVSAAQAEAALAQRSGDAAVEPDARRRLVESERDAGTIAQQRLVALHALPRLQAMRRQLRRFADEPPRAPASDAPVSALRAALLHDAKRLRRKAARASTSLEARHAVRKRGRRLRHAVEAAMIDPPGAFGKRMRRLGRAGARIQKLLGQHRDAVLLAERIERTRARAGRAGEDVLVYDQLAAAARARGEKRLAELPEAQRKLTAAIKKLMRS